MRPYIVEKMKNYPIQVTVIFIVLIASAVFLIFREDPLFLTVNQVDSPQYVKLTRQEFDGRHIDGYSIVIFENGWALYEEFNSNSLPVAHLYSLSEESNEIFTLVNSLNYETESNGGARMEYFDGNEVLYNNIDDKAITQIETLSKVSDAASGDSDSILSDLLVGLTRGACLGSCPTFDVKIFDNGVVIYNGRSYVEELGYRTYIETEENLSGIRQAVLESQFNKLDSEYLAPVTDLAFTIIYTDDKRVEDYGRSAPENFGILEGYIDDLIIRGIDPYCGKNDKECLSY